MEFVFLLIGLLFGGGILLLIPYMVYGTWEATIRSIKWQFEGDGILGVLYIFIGFMLGIVMFIGLCAFNNTFWHLDYATCDGLWKK